jgi:hypothetical protein
MTYLCWKPWKKVFFPCSHQGAKWRVARWVEIESMSRTECGQSEFDEVTHTQSLRHQTSQELHRQRVEALRVRRYADGLVPECAHVHAIFPQCHPSQYRFMAQLGSISEQDSNQCWNYFALVVSGDSWHGSRGLWRPLWCPRASRKTCIFTLPARVSRAGART